VTQTAFTALLTRIIKQICIVLWNTWIFTCVSCSQNRQVGYHGNRRILKMCSQKMNFWFGKNEIYCRRKPTSVTDSENNAGGEWEIRPWKCFHWTTWLIWRQNHGRCPSVVAVSDVHPLVHWRSSECHALQSRSHAQRLLPHSLTLQGQRHQHCLTSRHCSVRALH